MKEYEEKAVDLAQNRHKLQALCIKLKAVRQTCPLFDTQRWVFFSYSSLYLYNLDVLVVGIMHVWFCLRSNFLLHQISGKRCLPFLSISIILYTLGLSWNAQKLISIQLKKVSILFYKYAQMLYSCLSFFF